MNTPANDTTEITTSADLATWERPRTSEELRSFIESHHDSRLDGIDLE